jgi:predicted ribosomally synthesized peptide with SipW-like signal peptide
MKKRTKILTLVSVLALTLVLLIGTMGTGAWFKDTGTSHGNMITAGTLDLTIDGSNNAIVSAKMGADKLAPGQYAGLGVVKLTNTGNLPGKLSASIFNIKNLENGITGPEVAAGDTDSIGDLGPMLSIIVKQNYAPYDNFQYMTGLSDGKTLYALHMGGTPDITIQPGETLEFQLNAQWVATDNDNIAQGDSVEFDLCFTLDQIHP